MIEDYVAMHREHFECCSRPPPLPNSTVPSAIPSVCLAPEKDDWYSPTNSKHHSHQRLRALISFSKKCVIKVYQVRYELEKDSER